MLGPLSPLAVRRLADLSLTALLGAGAACVAVSCAWAADITYPPSRSLADVATWLQRDTPLQPAQVVDVSPQAVTAITAASPMGQTRGFLASISSEAVDPAMLAHDGIASWSIPVEVDCDRRVVRLGTMTGYRGRDLATEPRVVRESDTDWVNPTPTAPLGSVIRALCDRDFRRPLAGHFKVAAKGPEAKPGPPPIIEVRPKKVASSVKKAEPDTKLAAAPARAPKPPMSIPIPGVTPSPNSTPSDNTKVADNRLADAKPALRLKPLAGGGPVAVQIGASPSLPDTQGLLAHFKKKFGAELGGLKADVATVQVDGKTVNRALIAGFANSAEANAFCKTLADAGQACFIRR